MTPAACPKCLRLKADYYQRWDEYLAVTEEESPEWQAQCEQASEAVDRARMVLERHARHHHTYGAWAA